MTNINTLNTTPSLITPHVSIQQYVSQDSTPKNPYENNNIHHLTGDYVCDKKYWKTVNYGSVSYLLTPFLSPSNEYMFFQLFSLIAEHYSERIVIIALSNDEPPTFYEFFDFAEQGGSDLRIFNLQTSENFGSTQPSACYSALEACYALIEYSTLLNAKDKQAYLALIRNDISFIWRYIKERLMIHRTENEGKELELIIEQLNTNSLIYWQLLKDHKITDFNFDADS